MSRLAQLLLGVERPSRYLGDEFGVPPPRTGVRLRVVLGFPDVYEVGMSHLGYRALHADLAAREDLQVERVFLPWPDLQQRLQRAEEPLFALESQRPVLECDLLGLSVQYELAYPALLKLLDLAGIPRRHEERAAAAQRYPLVLVGGAAALNPEPLAPFVDAFFVGEADRALHRIVDLLAEHNDAPLAERLAALARLPGVYVPSLVQTRTLQSGLSAPARALPPAILPVQRQWVEDLDALQPAPVALVPSAAPVHDRVVVELQRGCAQGCRFCQAGFVTRPTRQRSPDEVLRWARQQLEATGYQTLALLSLSAGDYPCLQQVLAQLIAEHGPRDVAVSLPSLRVESLHPTVARQIARTRRTTFTLAPEAATDRLRRVINKQNSEEDLLRAVDAVLRAGFSRIKLYFMIGLPTETDDDVAAIAALSQRVAARARGCKRRFGGLTVAVSTFVPKPHTPFQWERVPGSDEVRAKLRLLQGTMPRQIPLRWHDPGQSLLEAYLARGDRRLAAVLARVVDREHNGLDAWTEHFSLERWQAALDAAAAAGEIPPPETYLAARDPAAPLSWDHIDVGLERDYLLDQRRAALAGETRPDCSDGTCDQCGVCPAEPLHRIVAADPAAQGPEPEPTEEATPEVKASRAPAVRLRIWFEKRDRSALLAHLEMVGVFERALRRAGLALAYSGGFRPRPLMRFTPALPLGAESACEFAEIGLRRAHDPGAVLEALGRALPPGLKLRRVEPVEDNLLGRIQGVRWELWPDPPLAPEALEAARRRLEDPDLVLQRKKGKPRPLAPLVAGLEPVPGGGLEVQARFGEGGTVRPEEVLRLLLGLDPEQVQRARVVRAEWTLAPKPSSSGAPASPGDPAVG